MTAADVATLSVFAADGTAAPVSLATALNEHGDRLRARSGQMIVTFGTHSEGVYLVKSGAVRITIFSADGREVIMRDQPAGSFFGDLSAIDNGRRSTSVVAVGNSELLVIPSATFRKLVFATPEAAEWFTRHLVWHVRALTERVLELSTLNVRSRLHCHLLRLCAVAGAADNRAIIDPLPTHEVLANLIGTHREAVTREISYLASVGIVSPGRRKLEVCDIERLARLVRNVASNMTT